MHAVSHTVAKRMKRVEAKKLTNRVHNQTDSKKLS